MSGVPHMYMYIYIYILEEGPPFGEARLYSQSVDLECLAVFEMIEHRSGAPIFTAFGCLWMLRGGTF